MIKIDKGTLLIDGTNIDICFELYHLFDELCKNSPEILAVLELEFEEKTSFSKNQ